MKKMYGIIAAVASVLAGSIFFLLYNNWIIISVSTPGFIKNEQAHVPIIARRTIALWYCQNNHLKQEKKEIFWYASVEKQVKSIVESWLHVMDEEGILEKPCTLQSVSMVNHTQELLISFDRSPLQRESATITNTLIIQSLLKTFYDAKISIKSVRFLVHQEPMADATLDFSRSWPLQGYYPCPECKDNPLTTKLNDKNLPFIIMLDPAGDAKKTGRIIGDTLERSISLNFAEKLKVSLESALMSSGRPVQIIITRVPGEIIDAFQNASFANRLKATLYISLNFYHKAHSENPLYVFYSLYDPNSDFLYKTNNQASFLHYNQSHLFSLKESFAWACKLATQLRLSASTSGFTIHDPLGLPFKPLLGITIPSLAIEYGVVDNQNAQLLVGPLAHAISALVKTVISSHS